MGNWEVFIAITSSVQFSPKSQGMNTPIEEPQRNKEFANFYGSKYILTVSIESCIKVNSS